MFPCDSPKILSTKMSIYSTGRPGNGREGSRVFGTSRLIRFCLDAEGLGIGTLRVTPPVFGSTQLLHGAIARSLFLLDQDIVIDALDSPLVGWIEGLCVLNSPVVGQEKGLVEYGALLEWACLDVPVDGWIKGIGTLDIPWVGQNKYQGGLGTLLEWAKARCVLLLMSSLESDWCQFALCSWKVGAIGDNLEPGFSIWYDG